MKIKKLCSLSSSSSLGILHFDHSSLTRLDSVDWLCPLPNKEDEKKINDRWIENAFKDYEDTNFRLINLIRDLKMEDAITYTPLNNIPSTNRRVTFSDANTNLSYYFNEIDDEKGEGDETFAVSQSPLPLSVKRPNATSSKATTLKATKSKATSKVTTLKTKTPKTKTSKAIIPKASTPKASTTRPKVNAITTTATRMQALDKLIKVSVN